MKTYELFSGDELNIAELIQQRRYQLLVHSCLYYEFDTNIVSDKKWDAWAKELVKLQSDYSQISEKIEWYEAFKDWDGSTGAFLPLKDSRVLRIVAKVYGKKHKTQNINSISAQNVQKPKLKSPSKAKSSSNRLF